MKQNPIVTQRGRQRFLLKEIETFTGSIGIQKDRLYFKAKINFSQNHPYLGGVILVCEVGFWLAFGFAGADAGDNPEDNCEDKDGD